MPPRTGTSHAIEAFVATVSASYLKDVLQHFVILSDVSP
jgi:hypothetical protein